MKLEWTEELSVGVKVIDVQHKHFIDLINRTFEVYQSLELRNSLPQILDELITYTALVAILAILLSV